MRTMFLMGCAVALLGCNGQKFTGQSCTSGDDCDDGMFCNGTEKCLGGQCLTGIVPDCDDGLSCTIDSCSENRRSCESQVPDVDGDGFGDVTCIDRAGVPLGNDCDDRNAGRFPGNLETCDRDGVDEDCDSDTLGGIDSDLDGYEDARCRNLLPDGGGRSGTDCDDTDPATHPGQIEICNFRDDNCSGVADEGVQITVYKDEDHDGFGSGAASLGCLSPLTSPFGGDCDDTRPMIRPGSVSCVASSPGQYAMCTLDGGIETGFCSGQTCRPQPNGTGICL